MAKGSSSSAARVDVARGMGQSGFSQSGFGLRLHRAHGGKGSEWVGVGQRGRGGCGRLDRLRRRDGRGRLGRTANVGQALVEPFPGVVQQLGGARLAGADALGQLRGAGGLALVDVGADPDHLVGDLVDGLGGAAVGVGDALGQPLGDAGDLAAQLLQRLGLGVIGVAQAALHGVGQARDLAAHALHGRGAAALHRRQALARLLGGLAHLQLGGGHPVAQAMGHAQHLAPDAVDRLGRALLGLLDVAAEFAQRRFHLLHPAVGGGAQALGQVGARRLHPLLQVERQGLEAPLHLGAGMAGPASLAGAQARVEAGEGGLERLHRGGGAGLGLVETLGHAGQHGLHLLGVGIGGGRGAHHRLHLVQAVGEGLGGVEGCGVRGFGGAQSGGMGGLGRLLNLGAGLGRALGLLVQAHGHAAQRRFQRLQPFGPGAVLALQLAQALGDAGLGGADVLDRGFQAHAAALLALDLVQAREHAHDRLVHAADGQHRALLGRLHPGGERLDRPGQAVGVGVLAGAQEGRAAAATGLGLAVEVVQGTARFERGRGGGLGLAAVDDHLVQPVAERHAGPARQVLGDLARLGVYALYAPGAGRCHGSALSRSRRIKLYGP